MVTYVRAMIYALKNAVAGLKCTENGQIQGGRRSTRGKMLSTLPIMKI